MQAILKLISLILWAIDYAKSNPKKAGAATVGAAGLTTAAMFYSPGVPTGPYFYPSGTPTDGYVVTAQADGSPAWEAGGGGSGLTVTGSPTNGDSVGWNPNGGASGQWEPRNPGAGVVDVQAYGASGRGETSTTGTASAASTTLTLASASTFAKGQGIAVVGAGATHGLAAPSAPIIGVGGTSGATTYEWGVVTMSGDGGCSAVSTTTQTTAGNATLSATNYGYVCWKTVANNDGFLITGRSSTQADRGVIARVPGAFNAKILTFQAGGYTNCVQSDIGKAVVGPSGSDGRLAGFDNTAREWWVIPTIFGSDPFTSFGSVTITTGTGAGTSTAVADGYAWKDTGDDSAIESTMASGVEVLGTENPSLARRANTTYYPGEIIKHPNTPAGQYYICSAVYPVSNQYPKTSATATGSLSLGTTIGTEYADGDVYWRATNLPIPADEPTAAVPDLLLTTIADISGTTVTMGAAATNAVTSQLVLHNEWAAITAARAVAIAANATAVDIYFKPGVYNVILTEPDADTFEQWTASNGPYVWNLGSLPHRFHLAKTATVMFMPTAPRSNTVDSGSQDYIFRGSGSQGWTWQGGKTIMAAICEPKMIRGDGWNRLYFYGDYTTGAGQLVQNSKLLDAEVWGFGRLWSEGQNKGYGGGSEISRCKLSWGGADADALTYGSLAKLTDNYCYGHEFDGSDLFYSFESTSGSPTVNDATEISGNVVMKTRVDGIRCRKPNITITDNKFFDCRDGIVYCESGFSGLIANNQATNGGRFQLTGDGVQFTGNVLKNVQVAVGGGTEITITGGSIDWDTTADAYHSASVYALSIAGGTGVVVNGINITNTDTQAEGGIAVTGGTDVHLNGCKVDVADDRTALDITTAFSGTLTVLGGLYDCGSSGGQANICRNASAIVTIDGVTFRSGSNTVLLVAQDGTLYFRNNTSYLGVSFTAGLDYLEMTGNTIAKGGGGSVGITTVNAKIDNNVFGLAPTLTGITGLNRMGNQITTSRVQTMTALAANTDNLLVGICDTLTLTTSGTNNYNLTGLSGLALGNTVRLVNAEASGTDQITLVHASTSSAGNQFFLVGATNYALDPGDWIEVQPMTWLGSTYYVETARGP